MKNYICALFLFCTLLISCKVDPPLLRKLFMKSESNIPNSPDKLTQVQKLYSTSNISVEIERSLSSSHTPSSDRVGLDNTLNQLPLLLTKFESLVSDFSLFSSRTPNKSLSLILTKDDSSYKAPYNKFHLNINESDIGSFLTKISELSIYINNEMITFEDLKPDLQWDVIDSLIDTMKNNHLSIKGIDFTSQTKNSFTNGKRIQVNVSSTTNLSLESIENVLNLHKTLSSSEYDDDKAFDFDSIFTISLQNLEEIDYSKVNAFISCYEYAMYPTYEKVHLGDENIIKKVIIRGEEYNILNLDIRKDHGLPSNPSCKDIKKYILIEVAI